MKGETIQEIVANKPDSLWEFLAALPLSFEAQLLYALLIAGVIGMFTSFLIKWGQNQVAASPVQYFFHDNQRGTVFALVWLIGAAVGSISMGGYIVESGAFVGWGKVLFDGWVLGTGGDLGLNKAKRPEWTETERKAEITIDKRDSK